ncbi:Ppx/GppA phosphatase family protein [Sorangium cellulosum]|uniref:Ppx/GppA phosphatase family protein n=1 Tax=Sorangium cellulosum TaxID=56 RepID=A0A4P2PX89_SORCE|nr:Ppx/GppA phosphatase family protein [Sorangium cellulosum]AUX21093.1 Ppx/GppA phosphatase family protein [Sorangium cellulosum]
MRVAAIDIGTNSVLLLIAERRGGDVVALAERATITRLGQGVDAARALAPEAVERTLACLARYGEELRALGAQRVDAVGTSAMRDAAGGEAFIARARELIGAAPRVISGREEAELTFAGALTGLEVPAQGPRVVFDVGGGSTEIIVGGADGAVVQSASLDVGSVRLTERHIRSDPPAEAELDAVRADARAALATLPAERLAAAPTLVGVAGTVTTLAAIVRDVVPYEGARVHGARISRAEIVALTSRLASMPLAARRQLRALDPARADVIVAGSVLIEEILAWISRISGSSVDLVASDRGVRWGLAERLCLP